MKNLLIVGILFTSVGCRVIRPLENTRPGTLEFQGQTRSYHLHVPPSLPKDRPAPLVIAIHGGGGVGVGMEWLCGMTPIADREGFIVLYPDGIKKGWNDGREGKRIKWREGMDDVGFISALIDEISRLHKIDSKRIYATGISNGGFMTNTLGARLSTRIAAIAPVASGMAPAVAGAFKPEQPVSVMIINNTEDWLVPYRGGEVAFQGGPTVDTYETVRAWVAHNGCREEPASTEEIDADPDDGTKIRKTTYSGGREGSEVVYVEVEGGGHTWPSGKPYLPEWIVGRVSREMNASEEIWKFFKSHPRP